MREIEADSQVQVHGQDGWKDCVMLSGHATIVEDRTIIREMWSPSFKVWFPSGADDPNIALIHVIGEEAEYCNNTGARQFRYLYQSIKALVTGTTPEIVEGSQHGNVSLGK